MSLTEWFNWEFIFDIKQTSAEFSSQKFEYG